MKICSKVATDGSPCTLWTWFKYIIFIIFIIIYFISPFLSFPDWLELMESWRTKGKGKKKQCFHFTNLKFSDPFMDAASAKLNQAGETFIFSMSLFVDVP